MRRNSSPCSFVLEARVHRGMGQKVPSAWGCEQVSVPLMRVRSPQAVLTCKPSQARRTRHCSRQRLFLYTRRESSARLGQPVPSLTCCFESRAGDSLRILSIEEGDVLSEFFRCSDWLGASVDVTLGGVGGRVSYRCPSTLPSWPFFPRLELLTLRLVHTEPPAICHISSGFPVPAQDPRVVSACWSLLQLFFRDNLTPESRGKTGVFGLQYLLPAENEDHATGGRMKAVPCGESEQEVWSQTACAEMPFCTFPQVT
ncbi:uncharacterized protein [Vicugna pacos]|uniref:Uncharacterized protein n=1 Tax=Vicugna pacos TaxID=30538 RepID=A0ABM5E1B0_VICPA